MIVWIRFKLEESVVRIIMIIRLSLINIKGKINYEQTTNWIWQSRDYS